MRHHCQRFVRFSRVRLVAVGAVAVLTLAACGSASGTSKTTPGQSPTQTTASSSGGYNY
jgi:ABC-type glycerol-3-phosphate transport system substrate-binding protein